MRSAFAEAIEMFFADGGKVTRCPDGNALVPSQKPRWKLVGASKNAPAQYRQRQDLVLDLLARAAAGLTTKDLLQTTGYGQASLYVMLEKLLAERKISARAGIRGARLFFAIPATGMNAGGPASDSADAAGGGSSSPVSARPGEIAA